MEEEKPTKVVFADEDHCWINNQQFVSLPRFNQFRSECYHEIEFLNNKLKALAEENEAYKVLLKEKLNE